MEKIKLSCSLEMSRIVHGYWRLASWNLAKEQILRLLENALELGISTVDHADIYGSYSCEALFGEAISLKKELRSSLQIVTKCGIRFPSINRPENKSHFYDTSKDHIVKSVETSLKNFNTDYIDLLLIHRPDPFMNPEEVAEAFSYLKNQGKVLNFGVSNFKTSQFNMLSS